MESKSLFIFSKEDTKALLADLDVKTKVVGDKEYVLDENLEIACCPVCHDQITVDRVGNIAKGSRIIFCDNPACFASHLAKNM